jgi:hypothetical protein
MFTVEYVKDLKWVNAEHTIFECIVKYAEFDEEHPSGISGTDRYAHIQEVWAKANAGEYGEILEYVPPPIEPEPVIQNANVEQPITTGTQEL